MRRVLYEGGYRRMKNSNILTIFQGYNKVTDLDEMFLKKAMCKCLYDFGIKTHIIVSYDLKKDIFLLGGTDTKSVISWQKFKDIINNEFLWGIWSKWSTPLKERKVYSKKISDHLDNELTISNNDKEKMILRHKLGTIFSGKWHAPKSNAINREVNNGNIKITYERIIFRSDIVKEIIEMNKMGYTLESIEHDNNAKQTFLFFGKD